MCGKWHFKRDLTVKELCVLNFIRYEIEKDRMEVPEIRISVFIKKPKSYSPDVYNQIRSYTRENELHGPRIKYEKVRMSNSSILTMGSLTFIDAYKNIYLIITPYGIYMKNDAEVKHYLYNCLVKYV